jgi:hypothetical protein
MSMALLNTLTELKKALADLRVRVERLESEKKPLEVPNLAEFVRQKNRTANVKN